jgi:hypothetical protein
MRAVYGESTPTHCGKHKTDEMKDTYNKMCKVCSNSRATHGTKESGPLTCSAHKLKNYIDLNNDMCISCKQCNPSYGPIGGRRIRCKSCIQPGDIDLHHPMCINCKVTQVHETNRYDNYCQRCYIELFPEKEVSRQFRVKERYFTDYIKDYLKTHKFRANILVEQYDTTIPKSKSKLRPDVFLQLRTRSEIMDKTEVFSLIIEFDEDGHKRYSNEEARENELYLSCRTAKLVIMRFNPDEYTVNGVRQKSCFIWNNDTKSFVVDLDIWNIRIASLIKQLNYYVSVSYPAGYIKIKKWYYGYDLPINGLAH